MMYIVFYIYTFINKRRDFVIKEIDFKKLPKEYYLLFGYFILRIISNLYYVTTYGQALKTLLVVIFEQLLLLVAVYMLAPTKAEMITMIKAVVWAASFLFVVGVIESINEFRPFDGLYTISRNIYILFYYRLGLLRAQTTMMAPALYGNMCILILPLILYLYDYLREKKYIVIAGLDVLAIIHSGSRSDMIFLFMVIAIYFIYVLKSKERRMFFVKHFVIVSLALLSYMGIAGFYNDNLRYYYVGTAKSVLNEVGFDFDLDEGAPVNTNGFGGNYNGSVSRTRQFTGMYYVAQINPLFGLGSGAQTRRQVQFYWHFGNGKDGWISATAYDVGWVEIFCDEGLIGMLGLCSLLVFMVVKSRGDRFLVLSNVCYLLSMLSTGNMYSFLMLYVVLIMNRSYNECQLA
ncbi:O-antigen ligase family protein [Pseudobutyrivibrio sp. ACV-2]|uniref:O-antigen ligase family protein n=1 Tax=Pseudobutyrivibrio sp. ACV-2 TaxID=1520801 RepID=UPI0011153B6A|nr:O-antigen ligase family protein [Pseudobutyrivibrio sp. ACV-2]